ncbi:hypothetical protein Vretimale_13602 [Volvox reticuliferus]|uniref:Uncharacterized protein n=1 Tax=Volvox reticuliferus TaxID=1737510 RepID=A0A8J4GLU6_9CHLO|nr:hypothetical protein Vretifemale_423 [Volvox reticuliferus]GIM09786.1 hypothetical protein Vretimale_13602 [Volvox reticuliferus]
MTDANCIPEWATKLYSLDLSDEEKGEAAAILVGMPNAAVLFLGNATSSGSAVRKLLQQGRSASAAGLGMESTTGSGVIEASGQLMEAVTKMEVMTEAVTKMVEAEKEARTEAATKMTEMAEVMTEAATKMTEMAELMTEAATKMTEAVTKMAEELKEMRQMFAQGMVLGPTVEVTASNCSSNNRKHVKRLVASRFSLHDGCTASCC